MAILIEGMEMPISCFGCIESYQYQHTEHLLKWCCRLTGKDIFCGLGRDANCPLTEVHEPHGRLIDADALCASHKEVCSRSMKFNLDLAPTIIPASEEDE